MTCLFTGPVTGKNGQTLNIVWSTTNTIPDHKFGVPFSTSRPKVAYRSQACEEPRSKEFYLASCFELYKPPDSSRRFVHVCTIPGIPGNFELTWRFCIGWSGFSHCLQLLCSVPAIQPRIGLVVLGRGNAEDVKDIRLLLSGVNGHRSQRLWKKLTATY